MEKEKGKKVKVYVTLCRFALERVCSEPAVSAEGEKERESPPADEAVAAPPPPADVDAAPPPPAAAAPSAAPAAGMVGRGRGGRKSKVVGNVAAMPACRPNSLCGKDDCQVWVKALARRLDSRCFSRNFPAKNDGVCARLFPAKRAAPAVEEGC